MCGRMTLAADRDLILSEFDLAELPTELRPRYNIAPTQPVLTVAADAGGRRRAGYMRWGLIARWAKEAAGGSRMINARAETVAVKPAFKGLISRRRCAVLADGFYEWHGAARPKTPHYFRLASGRPFALAGLWDRWQPPTGAAVVSCTVITTSANDLVAPVHDRMPVILPAAALAVWLDPAVQDAAPLQSLLQPLPAELMRAHIVSTRVNSPAHDDPTCIQPLS